MERYFLKRIISVEVNATIGNNHKEKEMYDMFDELDDDGLTHTVYETV